MLGPMIKNGTHQCQFHPMLMTESVIRSLRLLRAVARMVLAQPRAARFFAVSVVSVVSVVSARQEVQGRVPQL